MITALLAIERCLREILAQQKRTNELLQKLLDRMKV